LLGADGSLNRGLRLFPQVFTRTKERVVNKLRESGRGDFFIRQGARREHSLSYATDDQRSLMEVIYDTLLNFSKTTPPTQAAKTRFPSISNASCFQDFVLL